MSKSALKPLESLVGEIKTLIEQSRQQVAVTVNATMTMLYWQIGKRINQEVLKEQRRKGGQIYFTNSSKLRITLWDH
ncbi:MAG: DUF1016 N-terminal domain-containing protein [Syntrophales bacterium]|nr:DUF1016 N-terminal domain-containing protein [Syntrophales bacterium]